MVRRLLATTAIAGVLATGAFAQTTTAPATTEQPATGAMAPAAGTQTGSMQSTDAGAATADIAYLPSLGADQHLATDLDGSTVYASSAADAETAGEIENFVVGADGTVVAAVIDTGSFLGDQSKTVAVPYNQIEWTTGENNALRAVLTATREQLTAAPAFAVNETATAPAGGMAPAGGTAATTGTMAPAGETNAMAPAASGGMAAAPSSDMAAATTTPATSAAGTTAGSGEYIATLGTDQFLSGDLIGDNVYSGPAADADNIGKINDLVLSANGQIDGVLVGVGGFLGIGEKDVGVPFDNIAMAADANGEPRATLAATKEQLTNAPTFDEGDRNEVAANTTATTTGETGAATTGMAAGTAGMAAGTGMAANDTAATGTGVATGESTASTGGTAPATDVGSPVTGADLTADNLIGTSVYGPENQTIGSIGDIALTPQGQVDAVIVDVGGFLGIGAKPVAVAMDNLQFMRDSGGTLTLTTQFTQDQLRNAPEYNRDSYAQNRDQMRVANPGDIPAAPAAQ
ncbi:PRC-barrel domain-containing protein [Aureimonas sp. ME7]|uniref:PRC-barrel domain-containing protein n=1 Tax=Aureimonas sp. ME7 TaxID=2744252 RepID=UPI0015F6651A|nr:PRC-barrel domain-containing protein [Aureimonas sp. ME7]